MNERSVVEIVNEIKNSITGDYEHDREYLISQVVKYRDHPNSEEISRLCAKLLVHAMPKDGLEDVKNELNDKVDAWLYELQQVKNDMNYGRLEEALSTVEELAEAADEHMKEGRFKNDRINKYFNFNNPFEESLYTVSHGSEITVRNLRIPFAETYYLYGNLLFEFERYEEAKTALEKAIRWNPSYTAVQTEYAECMGRLGDMEAHRKYMTSALNLSYTPKDIARAFRGLGYYFIEKEMWDAAIACEYRSLDYDDHPNARNELGYINQLTGKRPVRPSEEEFKQLSEKYDFPKGASDLVLGVAYLMAKQYEKAGSTEGANYFYGIYYSIAKDDEMKQKLEGRKPEDKPKKKPFRRREE